MAKRPLLAALLFSAVALPVAAQREQTTRAAAEAQVNIQNDNGTVSVTGWDRNEVSVRARGGDSRSVRLSGAEGLIRIRTDESVDLDVRVPRRARLAVRTSLRNQLPCVVERLVVQGQIVGVHLRLGNGGDGEGAAMGVPAALAARITRESAELLGLQPGLAVQALCKATAVRVERGGRLASASGSAVADAPGILRLPAKATRVVRGESGDEVSAELAGGLQMVGFAAPGSGLRAGSPVVLVVEDNAVVLALAEV